MAGLALPRKRQRELVQLSPEALDSVSMSAADPDYNRADDYDVEGALSDKWYDGIGLRRDVQRVGALARVGAAGAMEGLPALASLPRSIAGAIHAEPGERLQGAMQGFRDRYESIPGTAGIDEKMRLALRDAKRAGVPSAATFAAEVGTPGLEDFAKLAAIKAFHGSPHRFDKFNAEKIGTGEGAQAYGHGLYFAEDPGVSGGYARGLSKLQIDGRGINYEDPREVAAEALALSNGDWPHASDKLYRDAKNRVSSANPSVALEASDLLSDKASRASLPKTHKGHVYETTLDVDHEDLLDWDAPLSEQSPKVREKFGRLKRKSPRPEDMDTESLRLTLQKNDPNGNYTFDESTGEALTRSDLLEMATDPNAVGELFDGDYLGAAFLDEQAGYGILHQLEAEYGSVENATEALREAGIPGIRYLDGVSRGAPFRDVRKAFLQELPEDADFEEVMELARGGHFSPEQSELLSALEADDWLGFDYPSQAISAALGNSLGNYDISPGMVNAIRRYREFFEPKSTRNIVMFPGTEDSIRIDAINGEPVRGGLAK